MSKENFERFLKQVADSEDLQAKIGKEIPGDALVALGAAHGCQFSIEDRQAGAELNDAELEGVSGGMIGNPYPSPVDLSYKWHRTTQRFTLEHNIGGSPTGLN